MSLIVIAMLLVTGASGAYGYFFIYESDDSEVLQKDQEQTQEIDDTVEDEPEEPEEPSSEDNDTFFRGIKDDALNMEAWKGVGNFTFLMRQTQLNQFL